MNRDKLDDEQLLAWFEGVVSEAALRYPGNPVAVQYGDHPQQVIDLWGDLSSKLWVVSIHGGYFAAEYDRTVNEPLSRRLASEGMAVANIEYRRTGSAGVPMDTVNDVRAAIAEVLLLVPSGSRVVVTGHSAGGYLALTGAIDEKIEAVFPLAPVTDLTATARGGWDEGAIARWLGSPLEDESEIWAQFEPEEIGWTTAPVIALHGREDQVVPLVLASQFAGRHDSVKLVELAEAGHYEFLDPESDSVTSLIVELRRN
jgi:acetyl esterase/lipase